MQKVLIPGSNRKILPVCLRKAGSSTTNKSPNHYIKTKGNVVFLIEAVNSVSFNDASFPSAVTFIVQ